MDPYTVEGVDRIRVFPLNPRVPVCPSASSSDQALVVSCSAQSSGSSSQASSSDIDTTKSDAVRAPTPSRTPPTSPLKCDSREAKVFRPALAHQVLIWVPVSISSNRSYRIPQTPPVRLSRLHQRLPTRMFNPTIVAVIPNPPTYTSSITTVEVPPLPSSLVALVLQSSHHRISVDLRITFLPVVPTTPTTSTLLRGDQDPVPHLVNPSLGASNLVKCSSVVWFSRGFI